MEKKMWIVVLFVILGSSTLALGLSPMGPPKAGLAKGQYGIGLDYSFSKMDLEFNGDTEEVETNMTFVNLGYGITEQFEGFVRLGIATAEIEVVDFDSGGEFAYGFGAKVTFAEKDSVSWGGLFQLTRFEADDNIIGIDVEIDAIEIQIAAGPTYEAENMRIYGGPFLHFVDGDGDATIFGWPAGSFDVEQESVFGGYIGAGFDIAEDSYLNVEFQFTGDAWAVGVGLGKKF